MSGQILSGFVPKLGHGLKGAIQPPVPMPLADKDPVMKAVAKTGLVTIDKSQDGKGGLLAPTTVRPTLLGSR